jgi:pimeloyl-ACP methyl ester carboxylesterase
MSTYLLIPGAGGVAWFWHRVSPLLRAAGHGAVAIDLPGADPERGLPEYVDLIAAAGAGQPDVVLVAQSMGAFSALPACERLPVRALVLVNAMVPAPGETASAWWENTGSEPARIAAARAGGYSESIELETYFLHDVPPAIAAAGEPFQRTETDIAFEQPCAFERWPDVDTTVLAGRDDRFFPLEFQRRVARERAGIEAQVLPGGHLNALSEPAALADALLSCSRTVKRSAGVASGG